MYQYTPMPRRTEGARQISVYCALVYLFFLAIVLQNPVALAIVSTNLEFPVAAVYIVKDGLLVSLVVLIFTTKSVYRFGRVDQVALLIMMLLVAIVLARGGSLQDQATQLRFYLAPLILFFVGRNIAPFRRETEMATFIVTIGSLYVLLGLAFTVIDREILLQEGIGRLLSEKLGLFGRGEAMTRGFPINFYFYHSNGDLTNRAFGALFDPLSSAFFGAVLFFHLSETCRRKTTVVPGIVAVGVGTMIALSLTRAIIIGVLFALIVSRYKEREIRLVPIVVIFLVILVGLLSIGDMDKIIWSLDPSMLAHLYAYTKLDFDTLMLGSGLSLGQPRGAESLYLTIIKEHGLGLLFLYFIWLVVLYRWFRSHFQFPYAYATLAAMVVYALASLTTEHWFSLSSSALFWFLLGNNMTAIQSATTSSAMKYIRKTTR